MKGATRNAVATSTQLTQHRRNCGKVTAEASWFVLTLFQSHPFASVSHAAAQKKKNTRGVWGRQHHPKNVDKKIEINK